MATKRNMEGYIHSVSPLKKSKANVEYFDFQFQTHENVRRAVCFHAAKHELLKQKESSGVGVTLLNVKDESTDICINKASSIQEPTQLDFPKKDFHSAIGLVEVGTLPLYSAIDVEITVNKIQDIEYVNVSGTNMALQNVCVADKDISIRMALWSDLVNTMTVGRSYKVKNVKIKQFDGTRYLGTTATTTIVEIESVGKVCTDVVEINKNVKTFEGMIDAVALIRFQACPKCKKSMTVKTPTLVSCSGCKNTRRKSSVESKLRVSLTMGTHTLAVFGDTLNGLLAVCESNNGVLAVSDFTDEQLEDWLLSLPLLSVKYRDGQSTIVAITPTDV